MTTLSVSARPRKSKPAPVAKTTILFDATQPHAAARDFGRGILRSVPTARRTWTSQDEAWAARELNYRPTAYDRHIDMLAALAEAQDRLERGCLL
jgi:hypothetical protein